MIVVFLANGFEEIEAISVIDILRRAEYDVKTAAAGTADKRVCGAHGITVEADCMENEIDPAKVEMVVLPGGMPGTLNLEKSEAVRKTVAHCYDAGKWVSAICAAPSILGHMGLLKGKTAVCYPGFEDELVGAEISRNAVCQDGKIITAKGPGAAVGFGLKLVEAVSGAGLAEDLRKSMQCQSK